MRLTPAEGTEGYRRLLQRFRLPVDSKVKIFSKGRKMRSAIALVLSHQLELIILDEPTSGLDPVVRGDLY